MYHTYQNGFIEVVCGPMFAGKTEELIRRIKKIRIRQSGGPCFQTRN